jgi:hypothetical protein
MPSVLEIADVTREGNEVHVLLSDGRGILFTRATIQQLVRDHRRTPEHLLFELLEAFMAQQADPDLTKAAALRTFLRGKRFTWADPTAVGI